MDVQYQRCTHGNGATLLFFKVLGLVYVRTYVCADSHVTTKIFEIDELPNFLRYRALLAGLCEIVCRGELFPIKRKVGKNFVKEPLKVPESCLVGVIKIALHN